jgi:hypothetical protein
MPLTSLIVTTVNRRIAVLAIFLFCVSLLLATLLQIQQSRLKRTVEDQHRFDAKLCQAQRDQALQLNKTVRALSNVDRTNPALPPDLRIKRVQIYRSAEVLVPTCPN